MAESSNPTQIPSPPDVTSKEDPVTLDRPESPNPFLHADQVEFNFDRITFTTNNEVALLYPEHQNSKYFQIVSDFISKCCLKEASLELQTNTKNNFLNSVIMEYLVNISKRHTFWSLNEDILKIYYSDYQYVISIKDDTAMDDPNMTMEEYIKLEEEKARRRGRVFNWETATYGKIRVDDDLHDLRSVEAEFPAIVIDDAFAPQDALPCKSQVSTPVNDEIDFRISFDESDDEDYTIIYDKNSFSYKMIFVNNLKTDLENDNEKAGIPTFLPPKPTISYVDDLDFFKDFENKFPAIVYNVLKLGQNVLYFNDLFPFNVFHPDDLKSDEDNDNNEIDIIQSSEGMLLCFIMNLYVPFSIPFDPKRYYNDGDCAIILRRPRSIRHMAPLPPREQRHPFLRVQVVDFQGMPELIRDGLFARIVMEHRDDVGVVVFTSGARRRLSWRQFILALGLHTREEMESLGFARYWSERPPPSYTLIKDLMLRLCHRMMAHNIDGRSQSPKKVTVTDLFAAGRKSGAYISGGKFMGRLAQHFGLLTAKILQGLTVIAPELPIIDTAELDAPIVDEGGQADPTPTQAPPLLPADARTMPQRMAILEEDVRKIRGALIEQHEVIDAMARDFSRFCTWTTTSLTRMMGR
ncbi:hypothetical protein Tco_1406398 [Tanacetum coccineum]